MRIDRKKLAGIMFDKDITATALAQKCNVSRQTISNIRHGKSCLDAVGKAIANALEVDINDLIENQ